MAALRYSPMVILTGRDRRNLSQVVRAGSSRFLPVSLSVPGACSELSECERARSRSAVSRTVPRTASGPRLLQRAGRCALQQGTVSGPTVPYTNRACRPNDNGG